MDPYDSDSSIEDAGDFTDTGVLLGYASDEMIEDTISRLGGRPSWIDDATPPSGDFANCKVCNQPMLLLLQLHGDLPDDFPNDERRLYIFGCPRKPCNRKPGSIRALRATKRLKNQPAPRKEKQEPAKTQQESKPESDAPKQDLGASLFGASTLTGSVSGNANPFSSSSASPAPSNPFAAPAPAPTPAPAAAPPSAPEKQPSPENDASLAESFADKVRVSSPPPESKAPEASGPPAPWPAESEFPAPYPQYYLDAEYETLSRPSTPTVPENVTVENADDDANAGSSDLKDTFESEMDKAFMKFSTRLAHNPEQILRYDFRGTPLLYSYADAVGARFHDATANAGARVTTVASSANRIPRCEHCGSQRVFELQLVPHAISMLEEGRDVGLGAKDDAGMEWGTIILGVCSKDCGPEKVGVTAYREEWAGVQWEEQAK
ncbi:putative PDCD2_C domain protein [Aspergillus taichungensis]|uniref:Putative PDCD2_C domain protein n=1 Tax=Aspergillus taichungensis TaxID=482145 RepID=A0A2J5I0R9_9EURO|nr:putative PDCD2_C domain protein [Aspergillus taichungensis]